LLSNATHASGDLAVGAGSAGGVAVSVGGVSAAYTSTGKLMSSEVNINGRNICMLIPQNIEDQSISSRC
jgi:hypothetical protein